jgi:hypothetical protein
LGELGVDWREILKCILVVLSCEDVDWINKDQWGNLVFYKKCAFFDYLSDIN